MRLTLIALASASILSTATQAADAVDATVREYILSRTTATGDDWYKDDLSDLNSRQKDIGKRPRVSDLSDIKKNISTEKARLTFLREMRNSAIKKVDKEKLAQLLKDALAQEAANKDAPAQLNANKTNLNDTDKKLVELKAKVEALQKKSQDNAVPEEDRFKAAEEIKTVSDQIKANEEAKVTYQKAVEKYSAATSSATQPLENGISIKATVETKDNKKVVKYSLELDPEKIEKKLPREVTENLSKDEMKEAFDKVGADVLEKTYDPKKKKDEDIVKDASGDPVRSDLAKSVDGKIQDARNDIGSLTDPTSNLGKLQEEIKEKSGKGKEDEIRDIEAKKKIASYLKSNPTAKEMDPCDLVMKAVGWAALSTTSRQECSEKDPSKQVKEKVVSDKINQDNRKVQEESQASRARELADLQQHCEALYRQRAMQQATDQVTQPINALMDKLVLQYNSSELYASLCAPQTGEGADEFDKNISIDPHSEAARLAQRMVGDPEKLQKEREAVSLVMRRAIYSLEKSGNMMGGALAANQQTQMLDMGQLQRADSKVQRMGAIYNCSKSVLDSIDAAIAQRRLEVDQQLNGGAAGTASGSPGAVNVNSATAGSSTNRRVINGQRPATQRTNQLLRTQQAGSGNGAPTPNYMGN